jgi:hypothetical protein
MRVLCTVADRATCCGRHPGSHHRQHGNSAIQRHKTEDQRNGLRGLTRKRPKQPADVEPRSAQHGMQRIALAALEPASAHAVIGLGVPDGGLDHLAALQPSALRGRQRLVLAAVHHLHGCAVRVHAPVAQIDNGRRGLGADVLQQRVRLSRRLPATNPESWLSPNLGNRRWQPITG